MSNPDATRVCEASLKAHQHNLCQTIPNQRMAWLAVIPTSAWLAQPPVLRNTAPRRARTALMEAAAEPAAAPAKRKVIVIGAGWGGLSAAHQLSMDPEVEVTVVDAAKRAGGLVSDSFLTPGGRRAEAGQHGFWDEYHNIYSLIDSLKLPEDPLTGYAEQGQYSPRGLEAVWPVYRDQKQRLPTGLGQALYTRFLNLPVTDLASAAPLVLAFSEFDDSPEAWAKYDKLSFRDLCMKLGVSQRMYDEAFEPMILTGLFAVRPCRHPTRGLSWAPPRGVRAG